MIGDAKIAHLSKDATVVHFFLMFGYKLFSLYFPLFLAAKSFSIPTIGYATFLIYIPIVLCAPLVGFLNHRANPASLASLGILGYGLYALGMWLFPSVLVVYLLQIMLGVSAALFFVSMRNVIMHSAAGQADKSFAWFYVAPSYADAIAPAVGALLIWKFDFAAVFLMGFIIQMATAAYCFFYLRKKTSGMAHKITLAESYQNYRTMFAGLKSKALFPYIAASFLVLMIGGLNNTFFVLFLKNLGWTQNAILVFSSLISAVFLPISLGLIGIIGRSQSEKNISRGSIIVGSFYFLLGLLASVLNFYLAFIIMLCNAIGGLMAGSGRSGLIATRLERHSEESAAFDTTFSPLATAMGSLLGGFLIVGFGYAPIFIFGGVAILMSGLFLRNKIKRA